MSKEQPLTSNRTDRGADAPRRSPASAALDLLGLAARAGDIVAGTENVRKAVRSGKVRYVVIAADTAPTQQQKLFPLLEAVGVKYDVRLSQEQLGSAIGRAPVSAVGVSNPGFVRRVAELVAALPSLQE